jgi:hypothetical protein
MAAQAEAWKNFEKMSRPVSFVDVVGTDVLDDKEIADFVFSPSKDESVLSASLAFPENAVVAFHGS